MEVEAIKAFQSEMRSEMKAFQLASELRTSRHKPALWTEHALARQEEPFCDTQALEKQNNY
jgi:hypothetical protein